MNKISIKKIALSLLLALLLLTSLCAKGFDNQLSSTLQTQLDQFRSKYQFIGMSAAIVSDDYGTWTGTSGFSQESINSSISSDMLFSIGSVTKTYVATLVMQLEDDEILSIDDSLFHWLPTYPNIDSTITIKQLLKHESGIFNLTDNPLFFQVLNQDYLHVWQDEEIILKLVDKPLFEPGKKYSYSNTNYILLGMILKQATGKSISTLLKDRILIPLNLTHTFLAIEDSLKGPIAHGWLDINGDSKLNDFTDFWEPKAFYSALWTAGAMYSSAEESAIFMKALLNGDLVSSNSLNKMKNINSVSHSGLGLFGFNTPNNSSMLGHDGFTLEYSAFVYYDVSTKNTYSVLVNQRDLNQYSMLLIMEFIESLKNYTPTSISSESSEPKLFELNQNWPNPFNPTTMISFSLQNANFVQLTIFNMLGKQIRTLVNGEQNLGKHTFMWNGKNDSGTSVASGTYIYHLRVGQRSESKQMLLIR